MLGVTGITDDAVLLTSEVVTNALLHGQSECRVTVDVDRRQVRVEVHDSSRSRPVPRKASVEDENGRGLELLEAVAQRWGSEAVEGDGKFVWFELGR
ncbi:MAG: hypothetical protein NVS3B21_02510 [Acidimicrobiales bacterium]